jgi:hypothetical protein
MIILKRFSVWTALAGIAFAADASAFYTTPLELGTRTGNRSAGVNFSNIGSKMSYTTDVDPDFIPMNMRLGTTFSVVLDRYNLIAFSFDLNKLLVPTPPIYDTDGETMSPEDVRYAYRHFSKLVKEDPRRIDVMNNFESTN